MRKCIFAAAAAVAVLLSDIGGTAVYAGENVPYAQPSGCILLRIQKSY